MVPPEIATQLRRTSQRLEKTTADRNRLIVEAHVAGGSLREIAELTGISHVSVLNIVRQTVIV